MKEAAVAEAEEVATEEVAPEAEEDSAEVVAAEVAPEREPKVVRPNPLSKNEHSL